MSGTVRTEIHFDTGDIESTPGIQAYLDLVTGDTNTANAKNRAAQIIGHELNDFTPIIAITCASEDSATKLKNVLTAIWSMAKGALASKLGPVTPKFSAHGIYTIITGTINDEFLQKAREMLEIAHNVAGETFGHEQHAHIEFDVGNQINTLLASPNILVDLFNAFSFTLSLESHPNLFNEVVNYSEACICNDQCKFYLRLLNAYRGFNMSLRFGSFEELSEEVKSQLGAIARFLVPEDLKSQIPKQATPIIKPMADHGVGEVHVLAGAGRLVAELKIRFPGLSQFFLA
mmetsp:Transcript_8618/g.8579  ORF Transcript_8618/g.8579 Transcript_8618/m.8579 type:complete len:289 (-) Transcript_8618:26-892(-)